MTESRYTIDDLLRVMERLRDPDTGCPWDQAQDFRSIVPSTLEECYELAEAIEHDDFPHVGEELGDVLFQVIFYSQLGKEQGFFSFAEVVHTLVDKLLRRHPHVFANGEIEGVVDAQTDVAAVKRSWEAIKESERAERAQHGALDDVPQALPALPRAQKLQKRASRVGFDWSGTAPVLDKLREEMAELEQAMASGDETHVAEEMGDILFTCVNLARHLHLDAEASLRHASQKFESRFRAVEAKARAQEQSLEAMDEAALDALWEAAKAELKTRSKVD